ncbi:transcriptional regulator, TetR family [Desulfuromusa kysingii]|uniref:Transcriptional regulator, TetR family n=1 Tax=Desulfuromusa kysingii TaxID=37625 RepID=A0A1H4BM43_9BACT|nr:CerR family C-terminal domain-containing protein [Desulfuromusa kysingii]SEA49201.1 transcriptional regulator, TetR family [Desulfuromusa kysingii]
MTSKNEVITDHTKTSAKERLLETAIDVFGKHGYEASTTRMIAKEAGVNISSIPYYFNGKEGLYRAMISHVVSIIVSHTSGVEKEMGGIDFNSDDARFKAAQMLEKLLNELINFMIGSGQGLRIGRIILREQLDPSSAYELIFKGFMGGVIDSITALIMVISTRQTEKSAKIKAVAILGQVIVFRFARETVVRTLDFEGYSSEEVEEVRSMILDHTRAIIATL